MTVGAPHRAYQRRSVPTAAQYMNKRNLARLRERGVPPQEWVWVLAPECTRAVTRFLRRAMVGRTIADIRRAVPSD